MQTDRGLHLDKIFVTVDFKNKSAAADAVVARRRWSEANLAELQRMADSLHALAKVPVLVEVIEMQSCMGDHLSQHSFRDYGTSGCGGGAETCTTMGMWKNTVAFAWGLARMTSCVRHVVHVDNDIRLVPRQQHGLASWVHRAVNVLQANSSLLSIHPTRGPGPPCGRRHGLERCECVNKPPREMDVRWRGPATRQTGGLYFTRSSRQLVRNATDACLLTYVGPHKPDVPHFSIQAFVMDLHRFQLVLPLKPYHFNPYGPYDGKSPILAEATRAKFLERFEVTRGIYRLQGRVDPESIFEENAQRAGLEIVYMPPSELGIEKVVNPGKGRG